MGLGVACAAVASAPAQKVAPIRQFVAPRAIVESSTKFQPQINITLSNPTMPGNIFRPDFIAPGTANTLPLGGTFAAVPGTMVKTGYFPSVNFTGWQPPDPDMGVGPNHVLTVCNDAIAWHKKTGQKEFQQQFSAFFASVTPDPFVFDPKCFYDKISGRFFVVCLSLDQDNEKSNFLVGVSDDSDPNGNWFKYKINNMQDDGTNTYWLDYPGFGHSKDAVVLNGNMFGFANGYNGIQFQVFKKSELITGAAPTVSVFQAGGGSAQVMRGSDNTSNACYALKLESSNSMKVFAFEGVAAGTPTMAAATVAIPSFQTPSNWVIGPGGKNLDPLDGRALVAYYRGGRIYSSHTVRTATGDNASRWEEVNLNAWPTSGSPSFRQGGTVGGGAGTHMWMPAIAANSTGDIAMCFSRASTSLAPDFMVSYRRSTDPVGSMTAPQIWSPVGNQIYNSGSRWGDYFGMGVDPNDELTFWGIGMIPAAGTGNWQTVVQSFRVGVPVGATASSIAVYEGTYVSGNLASAITSNNTYYAINSAKVLRVGEVASATVNYTVPTGRTIFSLNTSCEARAIDRVSVSFYAYNWTTSTYDYLGASAIGPTDTTVKANFIGNGSKYVSSTGQVKVIYRAINPTNTTNTAVPYTFRIDQVKVDGVFSN